mmetsp:Transcript_10621/g.16107  ORF Transcript_10621/g.16107 Transcript_10621/m.16107 type:complete len:672 (-) Transcript_10621:309-2324(-)
MCLSLYLFVILIALSSHTQAIRRVPSDSHQSAPRRHLKETDSSGQSKWAAPSLSSSTNKDHIQNIILQNRHLESDLLKSELPTPFDHIVTSLPFLDNDMFTTAHYAGHIPASIHDDKKLFYWLFEPDTEGSNMVDDDIPLLIWLNGGPGCSSMDGLWLENGPFRLTPPTPSKQLNDWSIQINPHSWHRSPAYVLYVDQPVGTGLSFTKKRNFCKNDQEVDFDFHFFLQNFLQVYSDFFLLDEPEKVQTKQGGTKDRFQMSRSLYFSGESHAGHYIPSMMDYILERNDDLDSKTMPRILVDIGGGAIGNGWIDPYFQYSAADISFASGTIDLTQKEAMDKKEQTCQAHLNNHEYKSSVCFDLLDDIVAQSHGQSGNSKVSIYDNSLWEKRGQSRSFPLGHKYVERYLGGHTGSGYPSDMVVDYKNVLNQLHAEESISANQRYAECTDPPYNALAYQDGLGVVDEVVRILDHKEKPRLLFFNGMNDLICNHVGNEKLLNNLAWKHQKDWMMAKRYAWDAIETSKNAGPTGYMKEFENLMFLKIRSSGHMVPMDLPKESLIMMRTFLYSRSFSTNAQRLVSTIPENGKGCDDGSYYEESEDERSRKMSKSETIQGGWYGAFLGSAITIFCVYLRDKYRSRNRASVFDHNDNLTSLHKHDVRYTDAPEIELRGKN